MKTFAQKDFFETREYEIAEDGLMVKRKSMREKVEFLVRFERIGFDVIWRTDKLSQLSQLFFLPMAALGFIAVFYGLQDGNSKAALLILGSFVSALFMVLSANHWINRTKNRVIITGAEGSLEFDLMGNVPDRKQVDDFIKVVHDATRHYLRTKYFKADPYLHPEMQRNKFEWLVTVKAITEDEMFEMLKKLRTGGDDKNIGFMGKMGF
ncbi:MAG: hypothetical protein SH856_12155 [Flavobacteriales bacterium]|nr:hypothetical protein [Flavobacteriales bacterium]